MRGSHGPDARLWVALAASLTLIVHAAPAVAGPPYVTDDPEPTDTGHWEDRVFASGTVLFGETAGQAGFDINYGAAKDLQLTLVAPLDFDTAGDDRLGAGNLQLSVKYRFAHQSEASWLPDIAVFPQINLPTAAGRFSDRRASFFLPVWAQKDFGPWSTFGGGGYDLNPGLQDRNYWLVGWGLTRKVTDRLQLGGEIYHQTPVAAGQPATTVAAVGFAYQMTTHFAIMASGGPDFEARGQATFYTALQLTY
jgi:hypothetical protein